MEIGHSRLTAIVTSGGTREPIDDVRVITNSSRGRFGATIAGELAERGVYVTLLGSAELIRHRDWLDPRLTLASFTSFASLEAELDRLITEQPPDLLFMVAAVSDYSPAPREGKISSDVAELTLHLKRNPKILATLRERCGVESFLVGFKLLSGADPQVLYDAAYRQVKRYRLNLTVANNLGDVARSGHKVLLVTAEGGCMPLAGGKIEVARAIVDFALRRRAVHWSRSSALPDLAEPDEGHERCRNLLRFAQRTGLLPATDGNVSYRSASARGFWVTPRQVAKERVSGEDLLHVQVALGRRTVRYRGRQATPPKPSIDSSVQGWLYEHLPGIAGLMHFHDGLVPEAAGDDETTTTVKGAALIPRRGTIVLADGVTSFPYPCGTQEEAHEIYRCLLQAARAGRYRGGAFAVELLHHGFLIGLEPGGEQRLEQSFDRAREAWLEHMRDIGQSAAAEHAELRPIFDSAAIVGVIADYRQLGVSAFLLPDERGAGRGERVLREINRRRRRVIVADRCEVRSYYVDRGFKVLEQGAGAAVLQPPSLRPDLITAGTVCLLDPVHRKLLIGRRRRAPWEGYWAFPGGVQQEGETLPAAALRELREETGVQPAVATIAKRTTVFAALGDGSPGYVVTNFLIFTFDQPEPRASCELEARWLDLEQALTLRPMGPGTRQLLRSLQSWLGT